MGDGPASVPDRGNGAFSVSSLELPAGCGNYTLWISWFYGKTLELTEGNPGTFSTVTAPDVPVGLVRAGDYRLDSA